MVFLSMQISLVVEKRCERFCKSIWSCWYAGLSVVKAGKKGRRRRFHLTFTFISLPFLESLRQRHLEVNAIDIFRVLVSWFPKLNKR
ncbi:hypothetical protein SDJN02_21677, partial [Cucurbita argyrosperma subsp. argyrosperma]